MSVSVPERESGPSGPDERAQLAAVAAILMARSAVVAGRPAASCAPVRWLRPERVSALGGARGWAAPPHPAERAS